MIIAKDLKVGNIFWDSYGGYYVVTAINCNKLGDMPNTVSAHHIRGSISGQFDCNNIYPVALTTEILRKCEGFELHQEDCGNGIIFIKNIFSKPPFVWGFYPDELGSGVVIKNSKPLFYLHQLQNIIEDTTTTKLKVNL